jgi:predicted ATPase
MLRNLTIENFRSIERCDVDLAPISVFFGPTSAGKSSLFYGLMVLRNFVLNPNQAIDGLFNLTFQNLGGFEACIFNHATSKTLQITAGFDEGPSYGVHFRKNEAEIVESLSPLLMEARISLPYPVNQSFSFTEFEGPEEFSINWNGFTASATAKVATAESQAMATRIAERLNAPVEALRRVDVCPHRRGFFKPTYSPTQLTPTPTSEDEVATLIINDQNAAPRISINTIEIFDRDFRTHTAPGTAITFLQTTEQRGARVPGLLVNDGFGVNQVVYMLAKIHRPETDTILIEEPEVHLHPTVIRRFARVLAHLARDERQQLVFTTHSEQFLLALLACVKEGLLPPDDVACYHVIRDGKRTSFNRELVSRNGQISGGLSSFLEGELEDIKTFLSVHE